MDRSRMSLMTFPMGMDLIRKRLTVKDTLYLAKQANIPNVDVMNVGNRQLEQYLLAIKETGVSVYTYIKGISFLGSPHRRDCTIRKSLDTACKLQAKYLMIVPYLLFDQGRAKRMGKAAVKNRMIEGFRSAVEMARDSGVRVCFEITPHDASCLSGITDCMDILNAVPGLEFVFDTANMLPHGDEPIKAYEAFKGRISHVHLKDVVLEESAKPSKYAEHAPDGRTMKCVPWGKGIIPVHNIYERMISDGYQGQFAIEYVHPGGKNCALTDHIKQLDSFLKE